MTDTYQAVYDAVRSKISGGDIGSAVEQAFREANIGHYAEMTAENMRYAMAALSSEYERPSVQFRPRIYLDGPQWCALYGENLQDGVAGFGESPALAMQDFDNNWRRKKENPHD